jgi:hypothetical protein
MDGMTSDAGCTRHENTLLSELTSLQKAEQSRVKKEDRYALVLLVFVFC